MTNEEKLRSESKFNAPRQLFKKAAAVGAIVTTPVWGFMGFKYHQANGFPPAASVTAPNLREIRGLLRGKSLEALVEALKNKNVQLSLQKKQKEFGHDIEAAMTTSCTRKTWLDLIKIRIKSPDGAKDDEIILPCALAHRGK